MADIGPRRKAAPLSRPEGFVAPYDTFEPRFRALGDLVLVIFGIEVRGAGVEAVQEKLLGELTRDDGPDLTEHAAVKKGFGPDGRIWFAYWKDRSAYQAWLDNSAIDALFANDSLLEGDIGIWRESAVISLDHNETSYSRESDITGIANLSDALEVTPLHGYWGSARDRMVAAADDELAGVAARKSNSAVKMLGKRMKIQAPNNVCLIKTTQDLSAVNDEQKKIYIEDVEPALHSGLKYLRDESAESGCIGLRFVQEVGAKGEVLPRTVAIGYFESLAHLEAWTHTHPTHEKIMMQFGSMVERFHGEPGLGLWHEVTVFPAGSLEGEYVNCSADGALLRL